MCNSVLAHRRGRGVLVSARREGGGLPEGLVSWCGSTSFCTGPVAGPGSGTPQCEHLRGWRLAAPVWRLAEHFVQKVTDCAESNESRLLSAQNVTLCAKCSSVHGEAHGLPQGAPLTLPCDQHPGAEASRDERLAGSLAYSGNPLNGTIGTAGYLTPGRPRDVCLPRPTVQMAPSRFPRTQARYQRPRQHVSSTSCPVRLAPPAPQPACPGWGACVAHPQLMSARAGWDVTCLAFATCHPGRSAGWVSGHFGAA